MVNPVNNQGFYEYRRISTKADTGMENGEKFSLDYSQGEKDSDKDGEKTKVEADGVIAEFSSQAQSQYGGIGGGQGKTAGPQETIDFSRTAEQVKGFLGGLVKAIANFLGSVKGALLDFWNSDSPKTAEAEGTEETEEAIDVTEMSREAEGRGGLAVLAVEGKVEQADGPKPESMESRRLEAEKYLENAAQRNRYVKDSDLLTYYDRNGKIVQMNGADKNRILHGDSRTSRGV